MVLFAGSLLPYTQYIIGFTASFMLIPTGRDIFAVGYPLLPGDDKLLPAFCNGDPNGASFMWKVFGSNFVMLSIVKFIILYMGVVAMPFMIAMVGLSRPTRPCDFLSIILRQCVCLSIIIFARSLVCVLARRRSTRLG